ncbi:MAG: hypothetical protein ABFS18_05050 [Thermodesulfobacteriota bacterium]
MVGDKLKSIETELVGNNKDIEDQLVTTGFAPTPDPYDLWATPFGLYVKENYYKRKILGKTGAIFIGLLDWLVPVLSRYVFKTTQLIYPISLSHEVLRYTLQKSISTEYGNFLLGTIRNIATDNTANKYFAWGLGFPWMSKNGLYGPRIPFITHTPYVMEVLLKIAKLPRLHEQAKEMFDGTWPFLQSLKIMHETHDTIALSYAPIVEPRIVINANSYAALAYTLHIKHGRDEIKNLAAERVTKLINWIVTQQHDDGSWDYYADKFEGNFIDCFHSCFVVKNLLKIQKSIPESSELMNQVVEKGWSFIRNELYDEQHGLCRRFFKRAQKDPFRWDLYDQAEYLGLLVDFGLLNTAKQFVDHVESVFRKQDDWFCRIDVLGRPWGKNFFRWGIVPFLYHKSRLAKDIGDY